MNLLVQRLTPSSYFELSNADCPYSSVVERTTCTILLRNSMVRSVVQSGMGALLFPCACSKDSSSILPCVLYIHEGLLIELKIITRLEEIGSGSGREALSLIGYVLGPPGVRINKTR